MWLCPLCSQSLIRTGKTWACTNRHSFDEAKSGYLNLLPVQYKQSLEPGDNKLMVKARRLFHASGGYTPLMDKLTELITANICLNQDDTLSLFEAGCGEGSYLQNIAMSLKGKGIPVCSAGVDISKFAIEAAAKAFNQARFAVASNFKLPLPAASQDVVLQVFAPGKMIEYARILRPRGLLIMVEPGPNHLWELKQKIYSNPKQHVQQEQGSSKFTPVSTHQVSFQLELDDPDRKQGLLNMTPYVWKLTEDKRAQIENSLQSVTADFALTLWKLSLPDPKEPEHAQ
ncbi:putative RNA methyltransferase [Alteromonas ponticola]|uniref:Methyltransferase domain-containing protein n=1 Tax=Alteromonas ponticola TaxID=2720613 RepID=A0ABX1QYR8_9ALTE|nr:methyltransferase domain-containing protein [Alteromonas ponticola]NMH58486.1 methyltransferase domain-containing protein [Alteromonas ponticola]